MKKHIVCLGDSNTYGYCADPQDCADHGGRYNEDERWTCLLQKHLGEEYLVLEEGLCGRTTVFPDPLHETMPALDMAYAILTTHAPVDLLIIMLGTNDVKERFNANPACVAIGLERLILKARSVAAWTDGKPNMLVICPPHIGAGFHDEPMGGGCIEKSRVLARYYRQHCEALGVPFLDAEGVAEFNRVDFMHLSRKGHAALAEKLAQIVPELVK